MQIKKIIFLIFLLLIFSCESDVLKKARNAFREGDLKEAEKLYQKLIQTGTKDPEVLAEYEILNGNYKKAKEYYEKKNNKESSLKLARALLLKKDYTHAIEFYKKIEKEKPLDPTIYFEMGLTLFRLIKYKEAKDAFQKAILIEPDFYLAYYGLGKICFARLEYNEAIEYYKKTLLINKKYTDAYAGLGEVFEFIDDYKNAEDAYKNALKIDPKFFMSYLGLSTLYLKQAKYIDALKYYALYKKYKKTG
jgi:tetratricopeptide (TPR) repeat protein